MARRSPIGGGRPLNGSSREDAPRGRAARRAHQGPGATCRTWWGPVARITSRRPEVGDGLPGAERAGAGRVVCRSSRDGGRGRCVVSRRRAEHQASGREVGVEPVEDHAGLDPDVLRVAVDDPIALGTWRGRDQTLADGMPRELVAAPRGRTGTPSSAAIRIAGEQVLDVGRTTPTGSTW